MRKCGVFINISSLPNRYGIGGFGQEIDYLLDKFNRADVGIWQILPITAIGQGNSPYSGASAFAGNYLYIDPDNLLDNGWIDHIDYDKCIYQGSPHTADYDFAMESKSQLINAAMKNKNLFADELASYITSNVEWLADYALFMAIKRTYGGKAWWQWDKGLATRQKSAISSFINANIELIDYFYIEQFLFDIQWRRIREYADSKGIRVMGDMPIYVSHDSVDVWANPDLFQLSVDHMPSMVAGVPPDYFSATGQLWGNPIYNYDAMRADNYKWFSARMKRMFQLYDICRFDHFRAVSEYWAVAYGNRDAIDGKWVIGGGDQLLTAITSGHSGEIIAEDLGIISSAVVDLRKKYNLKGMRVMQFGFDGDDSLHTPHNYEKDIVAYTGTHDNNTLFGWLYELTPNKRNDLLDYIGCERGLEGGLDSKQIWSCIRTVLTSVADYAIMPFQDLAGWGGDTRINIPGVPDNNWRVRVVKPNIDEVNWNRLKHLISLSKRS